MDKKIDFVLLWVDGTDKNWLMEKKKYKADIDISDSIIRYRDWDNLKYWFRSVEKYAPWVNKIYFVTCGQKPSWLNENNPKLVFVDHKDYIPKEYLPTFSSHVIELHMHKIKGLSEQFVYFNDDTFITDFVKPEDFFRNGKPMDSAIESAVSTYDKSLYNIYYNMLAIINAKFNKKAIIKNSKWFNIKYGKNVLRNLLCYPWKNFIGFYNFHCPHAYLKQTFKEVWEQNSEVLTETSRHKFRSSSDVNQYLMRYWQLCTNNFEPRKFNFSKAITLTNDDRYACECIEKRKYKLLCINDSSLISDKDFKVFKDDIISSFEATLPDKSSFEK